VVVDVPKDIQNWTGTYKGSGSLHFRGYSERLHAIGNGAKMGDAKRKKFFEHLAASKRPLLYVGGGVVSGNASAELVAFAEYYRIPAVMTLMGLSAMPADHALSLGMLGMHGTAYANYAVEDCDFLIAVGARFDDRVAARPKLFARKAKYLAHIDIDAAEIGKVKKADWTLVSDARRALDTLMEFGPQAYDSEAWIAEVSALKQRHAMNFDRTSATIQPQDVMEKLSLVTDGNAIISTGVGQHQMWAAQYFKFRHPRSLLTSGSMGTMGFGLPAAIGAQLACPGMLVIDVDGDGSIRMNIGDLETATTYDIPVKVLLMNNQGDGMIRQWQRLFFEDRMCVSDKSLHRKNFVLAALADGYAFARRVEQPAQLESVLREFVAFKGPAFLEVMVDQEADVYPMVGPGQTYEHMVTGQYIRSRRAPSLEFKAESGHNKADLF
jgi:acetolactate synthase-1/2/3 large subunit